MVIASARRAQAVWSARNKDVASAASEHTERLQSPGHVLSIQTVVVMLALDEHFHQSLRFQPVEVRAGGRCGHFRHCRQLGTGLGAPVEKEGDQAGAGGLTDRGGDTAHCRIRMWFNIHTLMVNEVLLYRNRH